MSLQNRVCHSYVHLNQLNEQLGKLEKILDIGEPMSEREEILLDTTLLLSRMIALICDPHLNIIDRNLIADEKGNFK